jgi:hypothetical protein
LRANTGGNNEPSLSASQWLLLVVVGLGSLMTASQISALNAILPFVARSFGVDLVTIQWVGIRQRLPTLLPGSEPTVADIHTYRPGCGRRDDHEFRRPPDYQKIAFDP